MHEPQFNTAEWFNWQQPAVPLLLDLTFEACGRTFREAFGFPFFTSVLYYRTHGQGADGACQASWLLRAAEGEALGRWLVDVVGVPSAGRRVAAEFEGACGQLLAASATLRERPSVAGDQLEADLGALDEFRAAFLRFYAIGAITEPIQWYCEASIDAALGTGKEAALAKAALFTMGEEPYAFSIERSLLELAIAQPGNGGSDGCDDHARRFGWKANNYARTQVVDADHVRSEVAELAAGDPVRRLGELEQERRSALARKAELLAELSPEVRRFSMLADEFGSSMADRRKAVMNQALAGLTAVGERIALAIGVPFGDLEMSPRSTSG
jgi:hypothetical protein